MKNFNLLKFLGETIVIVGGLGASVKFGWIGVEAGIGMGIFAFIFILCFQEAHHSLDKILNKLTNAIIEIQDFLKPYFRETGRTMMHSLTMEGDSPLKLTDYGEKLVKESGFYQIFQGENRRKIIDAVKAHKPLTNYDIQEYSEDVLLIDFIKDPMMKPIKEYAFKEPISIEIILDAAALVVRDAVMEELKFNNHI